MREELFCTFVALLLGGALVVVGCAAPGERASSCSPDGGMCPSGETCSTATPCGVYFRGSVTGDNPLGINLDVMPVATGGTERVRIVTGALADSPDFKMPFDAATSGASLTIADTKPPVVTVGGGSAGTAYLRLLEVGTMNLFDRIKIEAAALSRADPRPLAWSPNPYGELDVVDKSYTWALWAGGTEAVLVRLYTADNRRLADESLTLGGAGTQRTWDVIDVAAPAMGKATIALTANRGAFTRSLDIETVSSVDTIELVNASGVPTTTFTSLKVGREDVQCFRAKLGTRLVAGAPWQVTPPGTITATSDSKLPSGCFRFRPASSAAGTITVTLGGKTLTANVTPSSSAAPAPSPSSVISPHRFATPGERALP